MSEPLSRLYDLALRTLDDQERRADALRARLAPSSPPAALGVTLLSGPLVGGAQPAAPAGKLALVVAVGGLVVAIGAAVSMLRTDRRTSDIEVSGLTDRLAHDGALDELPVFYSTMILWLSRETYETAALLDRLRRLFTTMLCGILLMLCGLAFAAFVG